MYLGKLDAITIINLHEQICVLIYYSHEQSYPIEERQGNKASKITISKLPEILGVV